jgi:hypothetical protein
MIHGARDGAMLGLDLSLRRSAFCFIPSTWVPGNWRSLYTSPVEVDATGIKRICAIVEVISRVASEIQQGELVKHVYVEQYAWSASGNAGQAEIKELGGALKMRLYQHCDLEVVPVNASSARKTLFGKLPRMKRPEWKKFVVHELQKMGAPWDDDDTCDAFVIANHGRGELGLPVLSVG